MGTVRKSSKRALGWACVAAAGLPGVLRGAPQTAGPAPVANRTVTEADCVAPSLTASIAPANIGEPVRSVTLQAAWVAATDAVPAHCRIDGMFAPVDTAPTARPINFRVILPASWNRRAAHLGGGGINGVIPNLTGVEFGAAGPSLLQRGVATYGSDSGHQLPAFGPRRGGPPPAPPDQDWALNEEAIRNFGYAQMKKTHDAAMVLIVRMYGERPRFNYYIGTSQGGREGLTVAQRYPADYDGVAANVPIVSFSTLMLAPELIRIHEKPMSNWVTPAKINAIRGEFMRQCDALDGLTDGIINNYMACRAIFDVSRGAPKRHPWAAKRCPDNVDANPSDASANACLTDGQISTLELAYSHYQFATPLANGVREFGMWTPNTDPSGSGLILPARFQGTGRRAGRCAHALASRRPRRHRLPDAGRQSQPARLRRRRPAQRATARPVGDSRLDEPGSQRVRSPRRQDDRRHRHQRYAGFSGSAARLLPVGHRQDGTVPGGSASPASS